MLFPKQDSVGEIRYTIGKNWKRMISPGGEDEWNIPQNFMM